MKKGTDAMSITIEMRATTPIVRIVLLSIERDTGMNHHKRLRRTTLSALEHRISLLEKCCLVTRSLKRCILVNHSIVKKVVI